MRDQDDIPYVQKVMHVAFTKLIKALIYSSQHKIWSLS